MGADWGITTAAQCPQSEPVQQDSSPSFGDGMMNVLEGVVGQNGDGCRKGHAVCSAATLHGDVASVCAPEGGRTHQWTVELRQRVRLIGLAPAARKQSAFFP